MLTSEFKNAFEYTKKLLNKESLFLFIACLIPFVNLVVLLRYIYKIVSEPSDTIKPPKLVKPVVTELLLSLLKIAAVALVWLVVAVVLIVPVGLIFDMGALGGLFGLLTLIEKFSARSIAGAVVVAVVFFVISILAVISEVNMIKNGKLMTAFNFKELLGTIARIGWIRYILFIFAVLFSWVVIIFVTSQVGRLAEIGVLTVSLAGIIALLPAAFFSKTISLLYDENNPLKAQ